MKLANKPEEIADFFVDYINSGNIDGIVSLYEEKAVLIINTEKAIASGSEEIRDYYSKLLANKPRFEKGEQRPAIMNGDIALTSTRLINGFVTAEVARKQTDGSWRWCIDQPRIATEQI